MSQLSQYLKKTSNHTYNDLELEPSRWQHTLTSELYCWFYLKNIACFLLWCDDIWYDDI